MFDLNFINEFNTVPQLSWVNARYNLKKIPCMLFNMKLFKNPNFMENYINALRNKRVIPDRHLIL